MLCYAFRIEQETSSEPQWNHSISCIYFIRVLRSRLYYFRIKISIVMWFMMENTETKSNKINVQFNPMGPNDRTYFTFLFVFFFFWFPYFFCDLKFFSISPKTFWRNSNWLGVSWSASTLIIILMLFKWKECDWSWQNHVRFTIKMDIVWQEQWKHINNTLSVWPVCRHTIAVRHAR